MAETNPHLLEEGCIDYLTLNPLLPVGRLGPPERRGRIYDYMSTYMDKAAQEGAEWAAYSDQLAPLSFTGAAGAGIELGYKTVGFPDRKLPPHAEADANTELSAYFGIAEDLLAVVTDPEDKNLGETNFSEFYNAKLLEAALSFTYGQDESSLRTARTAYYNTVVDCLALAEGALQAARRNRDSKTGPQDLRGLVRAYAKLKTNALIMRPSEEDEKQDDLLVLSSLPRQYHPFGGAKHKSDAWHLSVWNLDPKSLEEQNISLVRPPDAKIFTSRDENIDRPISPRVLHISLRGLGFKGDERSFVNQLVYETTGDIDYSPDPSTLCELNLASRSAKTKIREWIEGHR